MKPDPSHLAQARALWNLAGAPDFVRKVENWIYGVPGDGVFLRLTEPSHRDRAMLDAELDWMAHLAARGARIAHPVRSKEGRLVETIAHGDATFFASVFRAAPGRAIGAPDDFTAARMRAWGRVVAGLHDATKSYVPAIRRRPEWNTERNYTAIRALAEPGDGPLHKRFVQLDGWLAALPKGRDDYGLVHADVHHGNFFVDGADEITVFDFDDCHYHWFAYDIAVPFYLLAHTLHRKGESARLPALEAQFWEGYASMSPLGRFWIEAVPNFLAYRNLVMYYWCRANLRNPDVDDKAREWMTQTMTYCRERA